MDINQGSRIAVIGAGISGIAAAHTLNKNGFQAVVFEKSQDLGGVWATAYPEVHLQNIHNQYHLSDFDWPFKPDLHPTGEQIMRYLKAAVKHLTIRESSKSTSAEKQIGRLRYAYFRWILN